MTEGIWPALRLQPGMNGEALKKQSHVPDFHCINGCSDGSERTEISLG